MISRFDSVCSIRAVSFSSRKWHAMAISQPPPRAWPLSAAITGFGKRSILRITPLPKRMKVATLPPENAEPRSAPAQKILSPAPVMITDRTASSSSTELRAALSSVISCSLIALAGGRFRVTTTKLSSRANSRVSNAIGRDSFEEDRRDRLGCIGEAVRALAEHPRGRQLVHRPQELLGGAFYRKARPEPPGRHALAGHGWNAGELGGHPAAGGAPEELRPLAN